MKITARILLLSIAATVVTAPNVLSADKYFGSGNNSTGNWTDNNWYTANTGGTLTTAPGASDRARIQSGDQVSFDTTTTIDRLFMNTGGQPQQTKLTFDGSSRTLTATTDTRLATTFGSGLELDLAGGTFNTGDFVFQIGVGGSGNQNGNISILTGSGSLNISGSMTASLNLGTGTLTSASVTYNSVAGSASITGDVNLSALSSNSSISSLFRFDDSTTTLGTMVIGGSANFLGTDFAVEAETFAGGLGTYTIIQASSWDNAFDSYQLRTPTLGSQTVSLGQVVTDSGLDYKIDFSGNNLNLYIIPEPSTIAFLVGGISALMVFRRRRVA